MQKWNRVVQANISPAEHQLTLNKHKEATDKT